MKIGARSSRLSRAQAEIVFSLLKRSLGGEVSLEFVPVKTAGDRLPPREAYLQGAGAKGAFTGEIERLLLKGEIDAGIHSMKDMTSDITDGLRIGATPPRNDPRDALISAGGATIGTLPKGAKVGTSSLRRKAQLLRLRGDLYIVELHGNVDTRLRKVSEGSSHDLDAIVLAVAGLQRIGESSRISQTFSIDEMVPAVGQGTIAVQMRQDDSEVGEVLARIDDKSASLESECERAFAKRLGVDCNVPVGGCARTSGLTMRMVGVVAKADGSGLTRRALEGATREARVLGERVAEELLESMPQRSAAS